MERNLIRKNEGFEGGEGKTSVTAGQGAFGHEGREEMTGDVITEREVRQAGEVLKEYKSAKGLLDERVLQNEKWFRLRHWQGQRSPAQREMKHSAWLFNSIVNKHADFMDAVPECTVLPREEGDRREAERLTSVLPVILERNSFLNVYSEGAYRKLKTGTAVYSVLWDPQRDMGLGEIDIRTVDILNLFWEPGIRNIQDSRNVFYCDLCDNDLLIEEYPFLEGKLGGSGREILTYTYDSNVDTSKKSAVVDWYYKKKVNGVTVLHYCKFVDSFVLYASENDPLYRDKGWYDHGKYPFVFDPLFKEEGTPVGFGFIDIMKDAQEEIDILGNEILRNARLGSRKRYFTRVEGAVNEEEFADFNRDFVHVAGSSIGEESIREIGFSPLSPVYVTVLNNKIDELKETSGNRDFSQGGTAGGVTSGTAITALQEAGNKLSRDMISATYNAFSEICTLSIEIIRQFYTLPRSMRITGEKGDYLYQLYDNSVLRGTLTEGGFGLPSVLHQPVFDVKVKAHRQNTFSRAAQNADALNFYSLGFFDPEKADQSLACMELIDIENKEKIKTIIMNNQLKARGVNK